MSEARKLVNVFSVQMRWADIDSNRHVNNVVYFTYFEQARLDWLERIGMQTTAEGEGPVVVQTSCNYKAPISYPAVLEVRVYAGSPGRTSFPTYYEIAGVGNDGPIFADGQAIMVWTDRGSGRSRPLPDALRTLLAGA